jgi:hypothetical protein
MDLLLNITFYILSASTMYAIYKYAQFKKTDIEYI